MASRRPYVGGNWKMNLDRNGAVALCRAMAQEVADFGDIDVAIFPAFVHLDAVGATLALAKSSVGLGAQDVFPEPNGAFTGEVSIEMLKDFGAAAVIVGHSERRHVIGESDRLIRLKTRATISAGLTCVLCIGETLEQRENGETDEINEAQLRSALHDFDLEDASRLVIAYEPVWAIGTGKTATPDDAQDAHEKIRSVLAELFNPNTANAIRVIYGGSMKPDNASDLLARPDIDGGLIGGASLKAGDFLSICAAAQNASRTEGVST